MSARGVLAQISIIRWPPRPRPTCYLAWHQQPPRSSRQKQTDSRAICSPLTVSTPVTPFQPRTTTHSTDVGRFGAFWKPWTPRGTRLIRLPAASSQHHGCCRCCASHSEWRPHERLPERRHPELSAAYEARNTRRKTKHTASPSRQGRNRWFRAWVGIVGVPSSLWVNYVRPRSVRSRRCTKLLPEIVSPSGATCPRGSGSGGCCCGRCCQPRTKPASSARASSSLGRATSSLRYYHALRYRVCDSERHPLGERAATQITAPATLDGQSWLARPSVRCAVPRARSGPSLLATRYRPPL